jgi:hypothetical protein
MGYSRGHKWTYLEIFASAQNEIIIDSTAGDTSLSTIKMPDYNGVLTQAYLSLTIQQVRNANALNQNGIAGSQKVQFQDSGMVYHDAIAIKSGSLYCMPDSVIGGTFEYVGNVDLKEYLEPNGVYLLQWEDAESYFDSLFLYGTQMKMKLYFGG